MNSKNGSLKVRSTLFRMVTVSSVYPFSTRAVKVRFRKSASRAVCPFWAASSQALNSIWTLPGGQAAPYCQN